MISRLKKINREIFSLNYKKIHIQNRLEQLVFDGSILYSKGEVKYKTFLLMKHFTDTAATGIRPQNLEVSETPNGTKCFVRTCRAKLEPRKLP